VTNELLLLLLLSLQDEIVLVTSERADGSSARIVYRNNTVVNAAELERLCEKVCGCLTGRSSSSSSRVGSTWGRTSSGKVEWVQLVACQNVAACSI
jgi:hypothetical protein